MQMESDEGTMDTPIPLTALLLQELSRLRESMQEKDRRLEAQSRFFANISHEFRTPLALIIGPLEQFITENHCEKTKMNPHMMLRSARRILTLINQLLALAEYDSGKMKLDAAVQDIIPFLEHIAAGFTSLSEKNNVELHIYKDTSPLPVYFDSDKLEKIITNLLSNAFNYTPRGGKIVLSVSSIEAPGFCGGAVEISVFNTGKGIPPHLLPHIFDRFARGEGNHKYDNPGTGIGLALTKELVVLHGGDIRVENNIGADGTGETGFIIRLPAAPQKPGPGAEAPPGPGHPAPETININAPLALVVEDDGDMRQYIRRTLESDFKVLEAPDSDNGIRLAIEHIPDIIVSDIYMPGPDGYHLCRRLKDGLITSHIPIVLLTGNHSEEHLLKGLRAGADDYIVKPFNPVLLLARVRNLMGIREQLQLEKSNRMKLLPEKLTSVSVADVFYRSLLDIIGTRLSDPDFNVDALARAMDMTYSTLNRKVRALTGHSPLQVIRSLRLKRAVQLLRAGTGTVAEVALKVGFTDPSLFAKNFKTQFHAPPSHFLPHKNHVPHAGGGNGAPRAQAPAPGKSKPRARKKELILLVDTHADFRAYVRDTLEPEYRVEEAAEGKQGIKKALSTMPDLIVSDLVMPGIDGFQLCHTLKNDVRTSHIPIILLTGSASKECRLRGMESGVDDYIVKPFNTMELHARIENLIKLRGHLQRKQYRELHSMPAIIPEADTNREFLEKLHHLLEAHHQDPEFGVEQLAEKLNISIAGLYRKIRAVTGETPLKYIRSFRLHKAAKLLRDDSVSIGDIAFAVGFGSHTYFSRCFKETFHRLPSEYKLAPPVIIDEPAEAPLEDFSGR